MTLTFLIMYINYRKLKTALTNKKINNLIHTKLSALGRRTNTYDRKKHGLQKLCRRDYEIF